MRRRRAAKEDQVDADAEEDSGRAREVCRGARRHTSYTGEQESSAESFFRVIRRSRENTIFHRLFHHTEL